MIPDSRPTSNGGLALSYWPHPTLTRRDALAAYLKGLAQEDNEAKKRGFYVDLRADGSFTVPHEIDRPLLRFQIWEAADMIQWFLVEDHMRASLTGRQASSTEDIEGLLGAVLARGSDD
ncbi:hypothetical protein [Cryobacterium sp. CG_9.6]|uniref:hypothetical protein n=1 Tax=Cryobacterium sp. CG_9.6 TaxID=2760710 RepID=UPI0024769FA8|nr:hypothetical protein [Cryobacterium sp. CG_9.6]MDH6238229.1 hypothetical protein [Cryobacterium sp. CG_9.6]